MRSWKLHATMLLLATAALGGSTAWAAVLRYDLASLARRSSLILTGEVLELASFRAESPGLGEVILTDVRIRVAVVIKGEPAAREVTVRVLGGVIGTSYQICPESAVYGKGERVLVFLREHGGALWNAGWFQGKYRIRPEGSAEGQAGDTVEGREGLPIAEDVPLEELRARLRAYAGTEPPPTGGAPSQGLPATTDPVEGGRPAGRGEPAELEGQGDPGLQLEEAE